MKTSALTRILAFFLTLVMLASFLVACKTEEESPANVQTSSDTEEAPAISEELALPTDENGYILDDIPEDLKLSREIQIIFSEHMENRICVKKDDIANSVVSKAIYDRWQNVQDRLEVEIRWIAEPGQWNGTQNTFMKKVETQSNTGSAYDAVVCYNAIPGALAHKGLLQNLTDSDYIDLSMPWWPQEYVDKVLVNDLIYGIVESSSNATLASLHGVFFNNELISSYNLTSPYDYVYNDTWTFDNMLALVKGVGSDLNENGTKDSLDFFGVVTGTKAKIESWFFGMGYRYSDKNASGEIDLLLEEADQMIEWIDRFTNATSSKDFLIYDTKHTLAFFENRAILYMSSLQLVDEMIKNGLKMDYGVVPLPKGSDKQERYLSNVANHHDCWCVPVNAKDFQESTAIIECMASESYREVAPIYFDTCIKLRYAPDERLYEMYDMIRDSITFDFCQIYSFVFPSGSDPRQLIYNCTLNGIGWSSQWESLGTGVRDSFSDILSLYGLVY